MAQGLRKRLRLWLAIVGGCVVGLAIAVGAILHATFDGVQAPVHGAKVGPGITVVDGYVAAFILDAGESGLVLVDAGQDPEAGPILAALGRSGHEASDVVAVLLTHGHSDHRGGLGRFANARIYAHADELPLLRGEVSARGPVPRLSGRAQPVEVTDPVRDGDVFTIGSLRIQAFHLPGHTDGSVAWLVNDTLFLGDSATSVDDGRLDPSPWIFSDDTGRNRESLRALAGRLDADGTPVELMVFSHAVPLRGLEPLRRWAAGSA